MKDTQTAPISVAVQKWEVFNSLSLTQATVRKMRMHLALTCNLAAIEGSRRPELLTEHNQASLGNKSKPRGWVQSSEHILLVTLPQVAQY